MTKIQAIKDEHDAFLDSLGAEVYREMQRRGLGYDRASNEIGISNGHLHQVVQRKYTPSLLTVMRLMHWIRWRLDIARPEAPRD